MNPFTFLCISDEEIEDTDTIRFTKKTFKNDKAYIELFNPNLNFPKNSTVLYIPMDYKLNEKFTVVPCPSNSIYSHKNIMMFNGIFKNFYKNNEIESSCNIYKFLNI